LIYIRKSEKVEDRLS